MLRRAVLAALLVTCSRSVAAQSPSEFRPEMVLTLPRVQGYGLQLLLEEHYETEDMRTAERIQGLGLVSPTLYEPWSVRFAVESRQVVSPGIIEHRHIPTLFSTVPLAGLEIRNRSRVEIRDINGAWSSRWQDRSSLGKELHLAGRTVFTYAQADFSYDTRFHTVNRIEKTAGTRVGITEGSSIDLFFTKQDDSRRAIPTLYVYGALLRVAM